MRNPDCDICAGSGVIRLPVRQRLSASPDHCHPVTLPIREYSCPECGDVIPNEKIMICQVEESISGEELKEPDIVEYFYRNMALKLGDFLFTNNMIAFTKKKTEQDRSWRDTYLIRAKLGVISPGTVATFEQRVNERQMVIATILANDAAKLIRNWNSFYDKGVRDKIISKDAAIREIFYALRDIEKAGVQAGGG